MAQKRLQTKFFTKLAAQQAKEAAKPKPTTEAKARSKAKPDSEFRAAIAFDPAGQAADPNTERQLASKVDEINRRTKRAQMAESSTAVATTEATPHQAASRVACNDAQAAKYDVRSITSTQLVLLANELFSAGRISREQLAMLSFQPELKADYDVVGAQGVERPDPNAPRDALAEWRKVLDMQEQFGNSDYFTGRTHEIIDILETLDAARHSR